MVPYAREELIPGDGLQHPGAADEGAQGGGEGGREAAGVDERAPRRHDLGGDSIDIFGTSPKLSVIMFLCFETCHNS